MEKLKNIYIHTLLFLFIIITSCNNSNDPKIPTLNTEFNREFQPLLKEGVYQVEYFASKKITTEHKHLIQKISKLILTNSQAKKYLLHLEEGGKASYNSRMGITRSEHNLLLELVENKTPEKFKGTLKISKDGNRISIKGDSALSLLDSLFLNINTKNASFKKYNMSLVKDSIDISNEGIPKGDTLEIYESYKGPDGLLGLTGLDGIYELLIGRLRPSGKTYISFFTRQPYNVDNPFPEYVKVIF